jgi:glucan phosphoethanolaminetransferase (alkaline phosphatase superfamily)
LQVANRLQSIDILKINAAIIAGLLILISLIPEFLGKLGGATEEAAVIIEARFIFLIFAWIALMLFSISSILASINLFNFFNKKRRGVITNDLDMDKNDHSRRLAIASIITMVMGFFVVMIFAIVSPFITSNVLEQLLTTHQIHLGK